MILWLILKQTWVVHLQWMTMLLQNSFTCCFVAVEEEIQTAKDLPKKVGQPVNQPTDPSIIHPSISKSIDPIPINHFLSYSNWLVHHTLRTMYCQFNNFVVTPQWTHDAMIASLRLQTTSRRRFDFIMTFLRRVSTGLWLIHGTTSDDKDLSNCQLNEISKWQPFVLSVICFLY